MRSFVISTQSEIVSLDKKKFMAVLRRGQIPIDQILQDIV